MPCAAIALGHRGRRHFDGRQQRPRGTTSRVEQALAIDGWNRHVDDQQLARELRAAGEQRAFVVEHERRTVEHQFVLPADLVDVDDRTMRIGRPGREHALTNGTLADREGRGVDVDVQFGPGGRLLGERPERAPDVLADRDPDLHAADHVQLERIRLVTRGEVAGLVEDRVVRQQAFAVGADDLAVGAHRGGVVQVTVEVDEPDDRGASPGARRQLGEHVEIVDDEPRLEHQVLRRVARGGQLGERHDVASGVLRPVVGLGQPREIAVEIADGQVQLGERDTQHRHGIRLLAAHPPARCPMRRTCRRGARIVRRT